MCDAGTGVRPRRRENTGLMDKDIGASSILGDPCFRVILAGVDSGGHEGVEVLSNGLKFVMN